MSLRLSAIVSGLLGLIVITITGLPVAGQDASDPPDGVEVLTQGPVHEAFAQPVTTDPVPSAVVPKQPPAPIDEVPPDQKPDGDNVEWVPGYWAWNADQSDFTWVSGAWRAVPPDKRWLPGHWQEVENGWMWVSGYWAPTDVANIEYVPQPPPTLEKGPSAPAPNDNSFYAPGCWVYREARYQWRPGYWIAYQPNWVWVPARYVWTPSGYIFVEGHWDHPLEERGVLFAPCRFDLRWRAARRPFVPDFVISCDFLIGALFVGPHRQHYYFGDYFDDRFAKRGFVAWTDYRIGRDTYDPMFGYYRHLHRDEPGWERGVVDLYRARRAGEVPRPPRTLALQRAAVKDLTARKIAETAVHKDIHITHAQNVTAVVPLKAIHNTRMTNLGSLSGVRESKIPAHEVKLQAVPKEEHAREVKAAAVIRETGAVRRDTAAKVLHEGSVPVKHTDAPKVVKLELPKPPPHVNAPPAIRKAAPPLPVVPRQEVREIPKFEPRVPPRPPEKR